MLRSCCLVPAVCLMVGACDANIDVDRLVDELVNQLTPSEDAGTGPAQAGVLRFTNISPAELLGTVEVFYTLEDGSATSETAVIQVPPDFAATFDVGCPDSMRFIASLGGASPFELLVARDVDYRCGELLEFAAGPDLFVRFVNTPL